MNRERTLRAAWEFYRRNPGATTGEFSNAWGVDELHYAACLDLLRDGDLVRTRDGGTGPWLYYLPEDAPDEVDA